MTSRIPEEYPPKIPEGSPPPKKTTVEEQESLRTIKQLGGQSTLQVRPLTEHAMEPLFDPRALFESSMRQLEISDLLTKSLSGSVHFSYFPVIEQIIKSIHSLEENPEAQHTAFTNVRDEIDDQPSMDQASKILFSRFMVQWGGGAHEIIDGDRRTYFNATRIQVVGAQDIQETQQYLQSHVDQGRVPQPMVKQFQINMSQAIAVTQQQSQASQQKGKAVAAQCILILAQAANAIALEEKTKKEQSSESKKTGEPSTAPLPQKQKSEKTFLRTAHEATYVFKTVQGKGTEEKAEELKTIQREKDRLHEEAMLSLEQKEKSKNRDILSQEIKKSEK
jgi:hypothetical protein